MRPGGGGTELQNILLTTKELAELLDLTTRRIQQIIRERGLKPFEKKKYDLKTFLGAHQKSLISIYKDEEVDYMKEKALNEKLKRKKAEIELDMLRGELHRTEDLREIWEPLFLNFKNKVLGLPMKVSPKLLSLSELGIIQQILKDECYELLRELSSTDIDRVLEEKEEKEERNE